MDWNAIDWAAEPHHTPGYAALSDLMTQAALGGSQSAVDRALTAYAAADLGAFTRDEQLTLDELHGDVLAQQYALRWGGL